MRYFLRLAYNGTNYHGWQYQPNAITVQEEVERVLSVIFNEKTAVLGCGRTDTGVHAKDFYLHFNTNKAINNRFIYQINCMLPKDIVIFNIIPVSSEAHARFNATQRTYEYHIITQKDPFTENQAHFFPHQLNIEKMNEAANLLLLEEDFACFCKAGADSKTTLCDVTVAHWELIDNKYIFTVAANRFLRNMVRAIVGTLLQIGQEKITLTDFKTILASKNRNNAGKSVAACGLYLTKVTYPELIIKNE